MAVGCVCGWKSGTIKRFSMMPSVWRKHARAAGATEVEIVAAEAEFTAEMFSTASVEAE